MSDLEALREQLSALLDGVLAEEEARLVRARIEADASVRAEYEALRATVEAVRALPAVPAPEELSARVAAALPRGRRFLLPLGLVAAAAAILAAVLIAPHLANQGQPPPEELARGEPPSPAPALAAEKETVDGERRPMVGPSSAVQPDLRQPTDNADVPSEEASKLRDSAAAASATTTLVEPDQAGGEKPPEAPAPPPADEGARLQPADPGAKDKRADPEARLAYLKALEQLKPDAVMSRIREAAADARFSGALAAEETEVQLMSLEEVVSLRATLARVYPVPLPGRAGDRPKEGVTIPAPRPGQRELGMWVEGDAAELASLRVFLDRLARGELRPPTERRAREETKEEGANAGGGDAVAAGGAVREEAASKRGGAKKSRLHLRLLYPEPVDPSPPPEPPGR